MTPLWIDRPPTWQPTPEEYYAETSAIGSGALRRFRESPEKFFRYMEEMARTAIFGPRSDAKEMSKAMVLGSVVDGLLTDEENFHRRFVVTDHKGPGVRRIIKVPSALYLKAQGLVSAIKDNPRAADILERPKLRQMCHKWIRGGLTYRLRADWLAVWADEIPIVVDLKVWWVDVADERAVIRHAIKTGSFLQLALYGQGVEDLWGGFPHLALIVASSTTGEARVYQLDLARVAKEVAAMEFDQDALTKCFETCNFTSPKQEEFLSLGA